MRLKSIKIAGFKSFADPIAIHVQHPLSAIVGPNGAGKSNVIDAMRWVTGESSAKSLRGGMLDDVIFSGSSVRKAASRATVELLIDNSLGRCPGQWASFSEISIRRTVTREGASDFYINNTPCRRSDIRDIFLGTGFGSRSYSIIEQGMISRIVDAKPEDLSQYIEEASGVSKFRARRHETNLRLNRTQENLVRLDDMRTEVEHHLRQLKRQADQAKRYRKLKEKAYVLQAQILAAEWQHLTAAAAKLEAEIASCMTEKESQTTAVRRHETELEQSRQRQIEKRNQVHEIQMQEYAVKADISNLEQRIKEADQKRNQARENLAAVSAQIEQIERDVTDLQHKQGLFAEEILQTEELRKQAEAQLAEKQRDLSVSERGLNVSQTEAEQVKQQLTDAITRKDSLQAVRADVENRLGQSESRIIELKRELNDLEAAMEQSKSAPLQMRFDELIDQGDALRQKLEKSESALTEKRALADQFTGEIESLLNDMHDVQVKLNTLQQGAYASERTQAAKQWLKEQVQVEAIEISEKVAVREGWERAVDGVLGERLSALLVDDVGQLAARIENRTFPARVYFVDNANVGSRFSEHVDSLTRFVDSEDHVIVNMLSGVYIADSIEDALRRQRDLKNDECVVTAEGAMIGPNWFSPAVGSDSSPGVLETAQLIRQCRKQAQYIGEREQEKRAQIAANRQEILNLELDLSQYRSQSAEVAAELEVARRGLAEIDSDRVRSMERVNQLRIQIHQRGDEQLQMKSQLETLTAELSAAMRNYDQISEKFTLKAAALQTQADQVDRQRAAVSEAIHVRHQHELSWQQQQSNANLLSTSIMDLQDRSRTLCAQRDESAASLAQAGDPAAELRQQLEQLVVEARTWESQLHSARAATEESEDSYRELDKKRIAAQLEVEKIGDVIHKHQIETSKLTVMREDLQHKLAEANTTPEEQAAALPDDFDYDEYVAKLERLNTRIEKEGTVNLIAVEQYEEEIKRKEYMDRQHEDLTRAIEILRDTITKIDLESEEQFVETFNMVESEFRRLVPLLFGGGSGNLEMTGDYPQDAGIRIFVRPKGKRIRHLQSLSGGEKALTAVALLLSFFQLNPSPLCLLDEIDAPLDDENVYRLCQSLKDLAGSTQVILITHNKITMEAADALIGVTMPEANVSRVLSVDLQDAQEYAA